MVIRWTQYAVDQFDGLIDNILERRGQDFAADITARILERIRAVAELPRSAPPWRAVTDHRFRRLIVDDYVVLYRISDVDNTIFVLAVRHGRQRPLNPPDVPAS